VTRAPRAAPAPAWLRVPLLQWHPRCETQRAIPPLRGPGETRRCSCSSRRETCLRAPIFSLMAAPWLAAAAEPCGLSLKTAAGSKAARRLGSPLGDAVRRRLEAAGSVCEGSRGGMLEASIWSVWALVAASGVAVGGTCSKCAWDEVGSRTARVRIY